MAGLINFEDEKEVKQFLDNLGVEYSYQCHKEKDPDGKKPRTVMDRGEIRFRRMKARIIILLVLSVV